MPCDIVPFSFVLSFNHFNHHQHGLYSWFSLFVHLVPIIPEFLYDIRHPDAPLDSFPRTPLTTPAPYDRDRPTDSLEPTTLSPGKFSILIIQAIVKVVNVKLKNIPISYSLIDRKCQLLCGIGGEAQGIGGRNGRGWINVCIESIRAIIGQSDRRTIDA